MKLYIVAGNKAQYHDCLRAMRTSPQAAVYVSSPDVIRNVELWPGQVVYYGDYTARKDLAEIVHLVGASVALAKLRKVS